MSSVPARDIRFLRGGGLYSVRTVDGAPRALRTNFDLPTQSANLDRVLTACGWGLTDDRDQRVRAGSEVKIEISRREPPRGRGARAGRPDTPPPPPSAPTAPVAERQISCVLERLKLTGCRFDHPALAAGAPSGASRILQILESLDMEAPDGVATDGQVFYPPAMITVTREQLL
jgi:hypothetical protein